VVATSAIVHFEIHYDDGDRAGKFYTELFGWKVERVPGTVCPGNSMSREQYVPGTVYWNITTQEGTYGGLMKRFNPNQKITSYFGVHSIREVSEKVDALGGKVLVPKMAVTKAGYYALCMDTEGNAFGLWEDDPQAK
jgi:predicted enzyme related to lactoylglutathione lyase